jgi:hypothetical protein
MLNEIVENFSFHHAIVEDNYLQTLDEIAQDSRLGGSKVKVILLSNDKVKDIEMLSASMNHTSVSKCRVSNGVVINFDQKSKIHIALEVLEHARDLDPEGLANAALKNLSSKLEREWKKSVFEKDLTDLKELLPDREFNFIKNKLRSRERKIKSFHNVTKFKGRIVESYKNMADEILSSNAKFHVLNGAMATGKTHLLRDIFSKSKDAAWMPIMITGKKTVAYEFCKENMEDHYQRDDNEGDRAGLVGVVNSVVRHEFSLDRERSKILIIDEVEDMLDHMATGTLGETYGDRMYAMDRLAELVGSADKVILSDAMITDNTLEKFQALANAKPVIHTVKNDEDLNLNLRLVTEFELMGLVKVDVTAGKKVAVFCDYRVQKFAEVAESFRAIEGCKVQEISRASLEKQEWALDRLDDVLTASDVAVISPVINSGVSITLEAYDRVYVLAGGTLAPTSLLQSLRRFRCAHDAIVAFRQNAGKRPPISRESVVMSSMSNTVKSPLKEVQSILKTSSGNFLAEYAVNRSCQFHGFRQVLLIAAEQVGFNVSSKLVSGGVKKSGGATFKRGKERVLADQKRTAFDASFKRASGTLTPAELGVQEMRDVSQSTAYRTNFALNTLDEPRLTSELYELIFAHDLDHIICSRRKLKRGKVVKEMSAVERATRASLYSLAFFEMAGVDFGDFGITEVTSETANSACELLDSEVKLESGGKTRMVYLLQEIFQNVNFGYKYKTIVVAKCLQALGLDLCEDKKSNGIRAYKIKDVLVVSENGVEFNLTRIANEYETLPRRRSLAYAELVRQLNSASVADNWY